MDWFGVSDSAMGAALLAARDIEVECRVRVTLPGAGSQVPAHWSIESADGCSSEVHRHRSVREVTRAQGPRDVGERYRALHLPTATADGGIR